MKTMTWRDAKRVAATMLCVASVLWQAPRVSAAVIAPPAGARILDFDDFDAPTSFGDTLALRTRYSAIGINGAGPGNDGGAVLAENGGFSVSGFSAPNVLAFNVAGTLNGGGKPQLPQTFDFRQPVRYVQLNIGDTSGLAITVDSFDKDGNMLDSAEITPTNAMQTVVLEARHIAKIVVDGGGLTTIIDDIAFILDTTIIDFDEKPAPASFAQAKALRREYIGNGFESTHLNLNDGAAVLDSDSNFAITGYSGPNFLQVNNSAALSDGGVPKFPVYLQFFPPVKYVRFLAANTSPSTITARGSFFGGPTIDEDVVEVGTVMKEVELQGDAMTFVEITSTGTTLAIDDIEFLVDGTKIDFDDNPNPPVIFDEATAIRSRYELLSVRFTAPGKDGPTLIGSNNFGVTGLSGSSFLAWDSTQGLADGGIPRLPASIEFDRPMKRVDFFVGGTAGTHLFVEGRDAVGGVTVTTDITTTAKMEVVPLYFEGTVKVNLTASGPSGVIDNLTFAPMDECAFDICYQGGELNQFCDPCVTTICNQDSDCCNDGWDLGCVIAAETNCEITCGPLCGDANDDRKVTAPDALAALKTAVGSAECPAFRCNFNGSGGITSGDALLILKTGVGQPTDPNCPPESN